MSMPLHAITVAVALTLLTAEAPKVPQASREAYEPISTSSITREEIIGENCYVSREPIIDEEGRRKVHTEVLCD